MCKSSLLQTSYTKTVSRLRQPESSLNSPPRGRQQAAWPQVSARALDNSSEPLAARAKERRISLSDAPQTRRSQASFPLAMAGPSIILSYLQRSRGHRSRAAVL